MKSHEKNDIETAKELLATDYWARRLLLEAGEKGAVSKRASDVQKETRVNDNAIDLTFTLLLQAGLMIFNESGESAILTPMGRELCKQLGAPPNNQENRAESEKSPQIARIIIQYTDSTFEYLEGAAAKQYDEQVRGVLELDSLRNGFQSSLTEVAWIKASAADIPNIIATPVELPPIKKEEEE